MQQVKTLNTKIMNTSKLTTTLVILLYFSLLSTLCAQNGVQVPRYGILFSEIMADPSPSILLPEAEYLELYNRTETRQELTGWTLKIGNTVKNLPDFVIDSGGYVIIIAQKYESLFTELCDHIVTLSSLSLTDGGQSLTLSDEAGNVIDHVSYRSTWHTASIKREGGWSLELKDAALPCLGRANWDSSTDDSGGTPGRENAIRCTLQDFDPPEIERVTLTDSQTLRIWFSEPLFSETAPATTLFEIRPPISINSITEVPPAFNALDLHLANTPNIGTLYTVTVRNSLCDCAGNLLSSGTFTRFGYAQPPNENDLIINEILSHPKDGSDADFIEIYNRSSKIIDLRDVKIGSGGSNLPDKAVVAVSGGRQLFPQQYCALCKDKSLTMTHYNCPYPHNLQACDSLPSYANAQGVVWLTNRSLERIDRLSYSDEMHYSSLLSTEGVSLERLRADVPTQELANWHSAASSAGYATPGYQNSQAEQERPTDSLAIVPDIISPDNDGYNDFSEIFLTFAQHDNRLTITICDAYGHPICHLVNNELCGVTAQYRWEGTDDYGRRVPRGQYLVLLQWWNSSGTKRSQRKVIGVW